MEPFKVYSNLSGRWLVLHWWTNNERGHLAFGKDDEALLSVAKEVFKRYPHAEVRAVLDVEVVAPPDSYSKIAADHDQRDRIQRFHDEMISRLREAVRAGRQLPSQFSLCDDFRPERNEEEVDDWTREEHYGCQNCHNTIRVEGMTKGDFCATFYDDWVASDAGDRGPAWKPPVDNRLVSPGRKVPDDEKLWYAHANFGHHAGGVELQEVDLGDYEQYRPGCLGQQTLFFYRLVREIVGGVEHDIEAVAISAEREAKLARKKSEDARRKQREREEKRRIDRVIEFFSSREP